MSVKSSWHGDEAKKQLDARQRQIIARITVYFWNQVQLALNISNPRPYVTPSKPGEPPRKRTGYGAGNVLYEFSKDGLTSRVGVTRNAKYLAILELFRNRPWLKATLDKTRAQLKAIAEQAGGGEIGGRVGGSMT